MHSATPFPPLTIDCFKNIDFSLVGCPSITPTKPSWGSWLRTFIGFNVYKARSFVLSHVNWDASASPRRCRSFIDFLSSGAYKLLESGEPKYLRYRMASIIFGRTLESSADDGQLESCSSRTKIGSRVFRCAAPAIWNCMPYDITAASSVSIFRSRLKTHYFTLAL